MFIILCTFRIRIFFTKRHQKCLIFSVPPFENVQFLSTSFKSRRYLLTRFHARNPFGNLFIPPPLGIFHVSDAFSNRQTVWEGKAISYRYHTYYNKASEASKKSFAHVTHHCCLCTVAPGDYALDQWSHLEP